MNAGSINYDDRTAPEGVTMGVWPGATVIKCKINEFTYYRVCVDNNYNAN